MKKISQGCLSDPDQKMQDLRTFRCASLITYRPIGWTFHNPENVVFYTKLKAFSLGTNSSEVY